MDDPRGAVTAFEVAVLAVSVWAAVDTRRVLWLLSYCKRREFSQFQIWAVRVPAILAVLGLGRLVLGLLLR